MPTESEQASTIGVTVTVPDNIELTSARTLPIPGWTANVETEPTGDGQRVSRITWRAIDKAGGIKPTEYGEFAFSAGPWPENAGNRPAPFGSVLQRRFGGVVERDRRRQGTANPNIRHRS